MKSITGIIFLFVLFSCGSCSRGGSSSSQRKIDTLVAAKVRPIIQQLQAQCDSVVMQAARAKADSILEAGK